MASAVGGMDDENSEDEMLSFKDRFEIPDSSTILQPACL